MSASQADTCIADILVVDDTPANLQLLTGMLKERGYRARAALNGDLALQAARHSAPDLILLDINMPGLSGYEVAEMLKQDEKLRDVPILFLSALTETLDKVRAFNAGGVDYIEKPFHFDEVAARVATHLKIRALQRELKGRNQELEKRNNELRELQELHDNLVHMIIHDMRSPLAVMMGYLDLIDMSKPAQPAEETAEAKSLNSIRQSAQRLLEMVNSLLDVHKMEAGQLNLSLSPCDLIAMGRDSLNGFESVRTTRKLEMSVPEKPVVVSADGDLLRRVLQNLVGNALKFAPANTSVRLDVKPSDSNVRVSISDSGCGIAPEHQSRLFTKFGQVSKRGPRVGTGLGLVFCKLAIEAHGGRIGVDSEVGKGSSFWFEIPAKPAVGI